MKRMKAAPRGQILPLITLCLFSPPVGLKNGQASPVSISAEVRSFVSTHCLDCHDDSTRKGDVSLESLGESVTPASAAGWLRALDQIERGTMPPAKKRQPAPGERQRAALALESAVATHSASLPDRETAVLRRLNRTEFRRTLEDLLHLDLSRRDPTVEFPDDNRLHGFASDGGRLVTSSYLMRHYLTAAKDVVRRAIHFGPPPETRSWSLSPPFERTSLGYRHAEREWYGRRLRQQQPYQTLDFRTEAIPVEELRDGVPVSGWYSIRVLAEAKFRFADMDSKKMFGGTALTDPSQPHRLALTLGTLVGVDPGNKDAVRIALVGSYGEEVSSGGRSVAVWDVPDDVPTWLECNVWIEAGQFPRFSFPNGPSDANFRVNQFVLENKYTLLDKRQLATFEASEQSGLGARLMFFETPRIRLHKIEVRGPIHRQWPPPGHRAIFGETPYTSARAGEVLSSFAARAWRRPINGTDLDAILTLVRRSEEASLAAGCASQQAAESAITLGVRAVLCAPEFLYREERRSPLDGYEIASRLSYFLWSSLPDDKLTASAASGALARPEGRRREAERLLADARSDTFVGEFLDGWLAMRKLGSMKPQGGGFNIYFDEQLEPAMRTESRLFFKHLLQTNGPVAEFLDSDHTFVNRGLAKLYGIDWHDAERSLGEPVEGLTPDDLRPDGAGHAPSLGFVKINLTDRRRGGLLGQASILTLTANGVDTSPVIRGIWLLENLLGTPPSPPPPNVPVIAPDIRGATTLRQRLERHRENSACAGCHQHIDPPGFALESFDPIGRWRGHYTPVNNTSLPVDPSGDFGGAPFKDVVGFKHLLLQRQPQFARCLVEKLLVHALGRDLTAADRPEIRRIVGQAAGDGYRLRDLVLLCCESELITRK